MQTKRSTRICSDGDYWSEADEPSPSARGAPISAYPSLKEDALLGQSVLRAGWHPSFEPGASPIHPPSRCSAAPSRRCAQGVAAICEPHQ